jgi:hypothetical protein
MALFETRHGPKGFVLSKLKYWGTKLTAVNEYNSPKLLEKFHCEVAIWCLRNDIYKYSEFSILFTEGRNKYQRH